MLKKTKSKIVKVKEQDGYVIFYTNIGERCIKFPFKVDEFTEQKLLYSINKTKELIENEIHTKKKVELIKKKYTNMEV